MYLTKIINLILFMKVHLMNFKFQFIHIYLQKYP